MPTAALSPFDTLRYVKRLRAADIPESQAEAQAEALREVLADQAAATRRDAGQVATKADVREAVARLDRKVDAGFAEVKSDVKLLKWMLGILIAAAAPLIIRAYLGG